MKPPQDYVNLLDEFLKSDMTGVKIEGASGTDIACLRMVIHLKKLPIEIRINSKEKIIYILRSE